MEHTDIAIVGAGLAGSLCAGMLGKKGVSHVLIDPREAYPDEFRCEKFNHQQIELLEETGLAKNVLSDLMPVKDVWMARFGRLVRKQHYPHYGFSYHQAVNAVRRHHVNQDNFKLGSVQSITCSGQEHIIETSDGTEISAKLVVLATGANAALQKQLGMSQEMLSERHCLAIGFDLEPETDFEFDTMTYWPESASGKMSYLTFFRTNTGWRANLFGYWNLKDPQIANLKSDPFRCLVSLMPNLEKITGRFSVTGKLRVRPINLYQWNANQVDGVVALGDAWSSSCPGAGTGTTKAMNDALLISKTFIPRWLEHGPMNADTLSEFYNAPRKLEIDTESIDEAYKLRHITLSKSLYWQAQRWARFLYHGMRGKLASG